jgi:uncharacterized protein (TIGR02147 family)
MEPNTKPTVFSYTDYRKFLKDFLLQKKSEKKNFSYRSVCKDTGIKSSGHLTLILQGKANISIPLALRFAKYLSLKKREKEFFQYLVLFNQAKNHVEKKGYFERVMSFKESAVHEVNAHQYEYYDVWYNSIVRALLEIIPVKDDFKALANTVEPPISPEEAKKSIELMLRLAMVKRDAEGFYRPIDMMIDSGATVGSVALTSYAHNLLELGKEAFDRFPKEERLFSWVTLGVSEKGYEEVVREMRTFRQKMYEIAKADTAERVYQIYMQAFPVSKRKDQI